ncbi:MAG: hypothetical protein R6U96_10200 [Promethearchaeia archaeon]
MSFAEIKKKKGYKILEWLTGAFDEGKLIVPHTHRRPSSNGRYARSETCIRFGFGNPHLTSKRDGR